jgi:putative SOS response-associated peptidase YedK
MCARFTLTSPAELVAELFGLDAAPELGPRYNIAPSQPIAVVTGLAPRRLTTLRWGLLAPGEAERNDALVINARAESVGTKPLFREAFQSRRCLVPADGFYEWRRAGKRREAFHIRLRDMRPFAFAGIWTEEQAGASEPVTLACAILTTEANSVMAGIHDRMPVILRPGAYAAWLRSESLPPPQLFEPYAASEMETLQVGPYVNASTAEGPRCLEPERQKNLFG